MKVRLMEENDMQEDDMEKDDMQNDNMQNDNMDNDNRKENRVTQTAMKNGGRRMARARRSLRNAFPIAAIALAMVFGATQAIASATDRPGREHRGFCDDVRPCYAACGDAGGTYFGLLPDGSPLCDCCAP